MPKTQCGKCILEALVGMAGRGVAAGTLEAPQEEESRLQAPDFLNHPPPQRTSMLGPFTDKTSIQTSQTPPWDHRFTPSLLLLHQLWLLDRKMK